MRLWWSLWLKDEPSPPFTRSANALCCVAQHNSHGGMDDLVAGHEAPKMVHVLSSFSL
jgi:hypothetical protein